MGWKHADIMGGSQHSVSKSRYEPVDFAPPAGRMPQSDKQFETPQMKYLPYREAMTPGKSATYGRVKPKRDFGQGDL